jgi:2-haloacid dehalogenase
MGSAFSLGVAVTDRWATFDCYGTLIDWDRGLGDELARLFGEDHRARLLVRYHEIEPLVEAAFRTLSYREVLERTLGRLADEENLPLSNGERDALARSLPGWRSFPEVRPALEELRRRGWRLSILSNTDRDFIDASIAQIGVEFDLAIVASEIGSYKPAHGHWHAFEREVGRFPDAHVAASLFHDVAPCNALGLPCVWINRLAERPTTEWPTRELSDLTQLPETLDGLVPG